MKKILVSSIVVSGLILVGCSGESEPEIVQEENGHHSHHQHHQEVEIETSEEMQEDVHHHHDEHEHEDNIETVWFVEETMQVGEEYALGIELKKEGQLITEGRVRFEVYSDIDDRHNWFDAEETSEGFYESNVSFEQEATYTVKLHIEKEDIHFHEEISINVQ